MSHLHEPMARRLCFILERYVGWINRIDKIGPDFLGPSCPENQMNKEQFTQMRKEAFSRPERILDFIRNTLSHYLMMIFSLPSLSPGLCGIHSGL